MNEIDKKILSILQVNADIPIAELSNTLLMKLTLFALLVSLIMESNPFFSYKIYQLKRKG